MSEEQIELIDKYIKGELNTDEKASFEKEVTTNPELKSAYEAQVNLVRAIKKAGLKTTIQQSTLNYKKWLKIKLGLGIVGGLITLAVVTALILRYLHIDAIKYFESKQTTEIQNRADSTLTKQIFLIDNQQDTVIETSGGIVLFIPANASVDSDGDVVKGAVSYQIQEALNPLDIMLAGLDTRSDGKLLETGGMFKLMANQNGQELHMNPQKQITVQVPTYVQKQGMQLFDGEYQKDGNINWVNPKPLENYLVPVDMSLINLLPPEFEHEVRYRLQLDMENKDYFNKRLFDSLYFSFSETQSQLENPSRLVQIDDDLERQTDRDDIALSGAELFEVNCASCHAINSIVVGPALKGISKRRSLPWLKKWIKNPAAVIASGDSYAVKLAQDYKSAGVMSGFPALNEHQIESIISYINDYETHPISHDETSVRESLSGVDPASVKAFWNKDYNNTILATREFESRMQVIHQTCNQKVLDLYIKNLNKNLWEIDLMAAKLLDGDLKKRFEDFAKLKQGKVKSNNKQIAYLTKYYTKKYLAAKAILKKQKEAYVAFELKMQRDKESHDEKTIARERKILEEEIELNTKAVLKQLGVKPDFKVNPNQNIKPEAYTATVSSFGWKNIDRYTEERETFSITKNGKTATIEYKPLTIKLKEPQKFEKVIAYLLPAELSSFMKMKEENYVFTEKLNGEIQYNLFVIGYANKELYYFSKENIKADFNQDIDLVKIPQKKLDELCKDAFYKHDYKAMANFKQDFEYVFQDLEYQKGSIRRELFKELMPHLYHVVFPCRDEDSLSSETFNTIPGAH